MVGLSDKHGSVVVLIHHRTVEQSVSHAAVPVTADLDRQHVLVLLLTVQHQTSGPDHARRAADGLRGGQGKGSVPVKGV